MNIEQLRYLREINNCRSMNKAGENLHISHQAVAAAIKSLEQELNVQLLERNPRGASLTLAGKQLLDISLDFLHDLDAMFYKDREQKEKVSVKIAASVQTINSFIVAALKKITDFKIISVFTECSDNETIIDLVVKERCEVGFCTRFLLSGQNEESYQRQLQRRYGEELEIRAAGALEVVCELSEHHPLAYLEKIPFRKLKKIPLIFFYPRLSLNEVSEYKYRKENNDVGSSSLVELFKEYNFCFESTEALYWQALDENSVGVVIDNGIMRNIKGYKRIPFEPTAYFEVCAVRQKKEKYTAAENAVYFLK